MKNDSEVLSVFCLLVTSAVCPQMVGVEVAIVLSNPIIQIIWSGNKFS